MLCEDLFAKRVVTVGVKVGCLLLGVLAVLLFFLGIGLIVSHHTQLALGSQIGSSGGALIFLACLYPIPAAAGYYGAKHHNKFLLLMQAFGLGGLMSLHFMIGGAIYGTTVPSISYDEQNYCLVNIHMQNNVTRAKCMTYFQSDDYAGLSLAWQTYFNESVVDNTAASALVELQATSFCCGLGPPANCIPNENRFPTKFPGPPNVPQTVCVNSKSVSQYYPITPLCYRNQACPYDHPIGSCGVTAVSPGSIGCAAAFHQYMARPVMVIGGSVLVATLLLVLCLCTTLVLLWKRKDEDTLPPVGYGGWRASAKVYLASDVRKLDRLDI
ncbi:hypothetical protein, variant [Saprolegnia diclina VS20]|uniref:Tetraspanin n=1 Tax=Saprolegnia diclina (strain VS20) TaxID=1156394 RepID=T0QN93_SAPDV|nr:hypothetical protein, variant [Saprolegnia diclina VS20]EQC36186.1 hypothetical protein, variant [Saprolegnia diclina VS20]|eukprot:XP_008610292.1 hypothetical protein, variant [Saprolegnia diclina VS20]